MYARRLLALTCCTITVLACYYSGPSAEAQWSDQTDVAPPGPPPAGAPPPIPGSGVPDGQWVYTQQYGWIWMTTADHFTYVPPSGVGEPLEYVFYGGAWTWIAAPWVWGYGPRPYWGSGRPDRFAWYRHGYWRQPQRWRYAAGPERSGFTHRGMRPPPPGRATPVQGRGGERGGGRGRASGAPGAAPGPAAPGPAPSPAPSEGRGGGR